MALLFSPSSSLSASNCTICPSAQVFHYYTSALELVQLVSLTDLPGFLLSDNKFELYPHFRKPCCRVLRVCVCVCGVVPSQPTNRGLTGESAKAKLLLDQLRSLRGKVLHFRWRPHQETYLMSLYYQVNERLCLSSCLLRVLFISNVYLKGTSTLINNCTFVNMH